MSNEGMTATPPGLWQRFSTRYNETVLIKTVFGTMLLGVCATLVVDYLELRELQALEGPSLERAMPVLPAVAPPNIDDADRAGLPQSQRPEHISTPTEELRQPMSIELLADGVLRLRGFIGTETAEKFAQEVDRVAEYVKVVSLDSPGGVLDNALEVGALIRERGFKTMVGEGAICASACPLIFAGGTERNVDEKAAFGLHQIYSAGGSQMSPASAMAGTQSTTALISRYLKDMGVDPAVWIYAMETPPSKLFYMSAEQLVEYGFVTSGES